MSVKLGDECNSLVAHLSAFAESRVRIPTACKFFTAASAAAVFSTEAAAASAAIAASAAPAAEAPTK